AFFAGFGNWAWGGAGQSPAVVLFVGEAALPAGFLPGCFFEKSPESRERRLSSTTPSAACALASSSCSTRSVRCRSVSGIGILLHLQITGEIGEGIGGGLILR